MNNLYCIDYNYVNYVFEHNTEIFPQLLTLAMLVYLAVLCFNLNDISLYLQVHLMYKNNWWLVVTLVVAFAFLPRHFGKVMGPMKDILSYYECRLSGGDTQKWWKHSNPTCCNQICLKFLHSQVVHTETPSLHCLC